MKRDRDTSWHVWPVPCACRPAALWDALAELRDGLGAAGWDKQTQERQRRALHYNRRRRASPEKRQPNQQHLVFPHRELLWSAWDKEDVKLIINHLYFHFKKRPPWAHEWVRVHVPRQMQKSSSVFSPGTKMILACWMTNPSEVQLHLNTYKNTETWLTAKEALVSVISHPLKARHYGSAESQPQQGKEDTFKSD